jgi:hypothetical protein
MNRNLVEAFEQRVSQVDSQYTVGVPTSDHATDAERDELTVTPVPTAYDLQYEGLDWKRVPYLQTPAYEARRSYKSWVFSYGWRVWHRKRQALFWLCKYCHQHQLPGGLYKVELSTSAIGRHLEQQKAGHGYNKDGKIEAQNFQNHTSILAHMQQSQKLKISQDVANALAQSFSRDDFLQAVENWVVATNQSLRVIESPYFREMIQKANPLAESHLWRNHQSLRDHIISEYNAYLPVVADYLKKARSLVHITFDNWTSIGGKRALTGICVHHLDEAGVLQDYVLGLPMLSGKHSGANIASVVSSTLETFGITKEQLGYFVLDNATNNDKAIEALAEEFSFNPRHRRLRCTCHILNLGAQQVIFGKDREAFENADVNLQNEEELMEVWRQAGPIAVLLDVLASICTPQARDILDGFQRDEAVRLNEEPDLKEPIKPARTRWNTYYDCFARAVDLRNPLDDYITYKTAEYNRETASTRRRTHSQHQSEEKKPRLFIQEGGLTAGDWATISEYKKLLAPFKEATSFMEGRGKAGTCGAIWEVIPTFDWLLKQLHDLRDRLREVDYEDNDAPEDHLLINLNAAYLKIDEYYSKLNMSAAYYAACRLHPAYKNFVDAAWRVPDDYDNSDEPHPREGWIKDLDRGFNQLWKACKDEVRKASSEAVTSPPPKKQRTAYAASRSDFMKATMKDLEQSQETDDEYEHWKAELPLGETHELSKDPIKYWLTKQQQYRVLSRFAIDILSIPAAAADCERTFSELGDLLGVRRLRMQPDLMSALQSLRSWKRLGLRPYKKPELWRTPEPVEELTFCHVNYYLKQFKEDD